MRVGKEKGMLKMLCRTMLLKSRTMDSQEATMIKGKFLAATGTTNRATYPGSVEEVPINAIGVVRRFINE